MSIWCDLGDLERFGISEHLANSQSVIVGLVHITKAYNIAPWHGSDQSYRELQRHRSTYVGS